MIRGDGGFVSPDDPRGRGGVSCHFRTCQKPGKSFFCIAFFDFSVTVVLSKRKNAQMFFQKKNAEQSYSNRKTVD